MNDAISKEKVRKVLDEFEKDFLSQDHQDTIWIGKAETVIDRIHYIREQLLKREE